MWPKVRTTWAEEKRIRLDILSFEAKEIDVNLKKFLSQKQMATQTMSQTVWG